MQHHPVRDSSGDRRTGHPNVKQWAGLVTACACGYEFVALGTGTTPTLTRLAWRYRNTWPGRVAIAGVCVGLYLHLQFDRDELWA